MHLGAADIAFAVTVLVRTERPITAAGVRAVVRIGREMVRRIHIVPAFVADAVAHTDMLAAVNNVIAVITGEMVIFIVVAPGRMFVGTIKFVIAAQIAAISNLVMGLYITQIGQAVVAELDMPFAPGRHVVYILMIAMVRIYRATYGAFVRGGIKGVGFLTAYFGQTVGAELDMTILPPGVHCVFMIAMIRVRCATYGTFVRGGVKVVGFICADFLAAG